MDTLVSLVPYTITALSTARTLQLNECVTQCVSAMMCSTRDSTHNHLREIISNIVLIYVFNVPSYIVKTSFPKVCIYMLTFCLEGPPFFLYA